MPVQAVTCPSCHKRFGVPATSKASAVRCPHCLQPVRLADVTGPPMPDEPKTAPRFRDWNQASDESSGDDDNGAEAEPGSPPVVDKPVDSEVLRPARTKPSRRQFDQGPTFALTPPSWPKEEPVPPCTEEPQSRIDDASYVARLLPPKFVLPTAGDSPVDEWTSPAIADDSISESSDRFHLSDDSQHSDVVAALRRRYEPERRSIGVLIVIVLTLIILFVVAMILY